MTIDRRGVLLGGALAGMLASRSGTAAAQAGSSQVAAPADDRIRIAARETRKRLAMSSVGFAGEGYDWLLAEGRGARFFCLGEEHGIAENARLSAQLFRDLVPFGYSRVAVEISPPMAGEIDATLKSGGFQALQRFLTARGQAVAFFGMREEAAWLAEARAAAAGRGPVVWGTDYEVGADRHLIALLGRMRKPAAAEQALARLAQASSESWARYEATKNPQFMFPFSGDAALVRAVRKAWPKPAPEALSILDTLQQTFEINKLWAAGQGHAANVRRAANLRENFLRYWRPLADAKNPPRVFLKYGSNHVVRGLTPVGTFDTGSLVAELAALRGERSFHLLVLPGPGSPTAVFDPASFSYSANKPKDGYAFGLERLTAEAWADAPTLFETEPLRRLVIAKRNQADPELVRAVMGFDAILVMSGSTASTNL